MVLDSKTSTRMSSRRRPLHTCAVSILTVAHMVYTKAQNLNGPLGSITRRITKMAAIASPVVYALQYQWLVVLSFIDDRVLAIEKTIETLYPPSNYLFDKIDELVQITESLPGNFDNAVNRFPSIVHQVPLLDWVLVHVIFWLNCLISTLTQWGWQNSKEKDIMIDTNSSERENESALAEEAPRRVESSLGFENKATFPPISGTAEAGSEDVATTVKQEIVKGTYKQALEKGTKESKEIKEDDANDKQGNDSSKEIEKMPTKKPIENMVREDPILELFESGWLMSPQRQKQKTMPRSVSYN